MNKLVIAGLGLLLGSCTAPNTEVSSPDGVIRLSISLTDAGAPSYSVKMAETLVFNPSAMGLRAEGVNLSDGFRIEQVTRNAVDALWSQPWGENKQNRDHHNEMAVELRSDDGVGLVIRLRLFDDGLGFRYEYDVPGVDSLWVSDELTEFRFAQQGESWTIPSNFGTYELTYRQLPLSELQDANTPATFKMGGLYGSIHEAALYDFSEMNLRRIDSLAFKAELAPLPDGTKSRVGAKFQTSWRTVQLAPEAVGLINSSLILNLNEPCKIADTSWIHPMKYVGVWWGMHVGVETWTMGPRHGATTANAIRHIDFAARNHIEAVLFEGWNVGWETWGGEQSFDYAKAYADFDLDRIVRHAAQKGVKIIGHHETGGNVPDYESKMDSAFAWYARNGVHDVKTGYAGGMPFGNVHHNQYGVRHYQKVIETAANYQITINAHEPIKETGIRRTWPNFMTREGGRSKEWDAWSEGNAPSHDLILSFTRMLSGPFDYTPGTFDILLDRTRTSPRRQKWNGNDQGTSRVNSTLAKQMALWVTLYAPMQMASDLIEHYEGHPAFQFFRDFDADCDWSKALAGEPGEFVAVVRRAGDRFFVGASTNEQPRTLSLPLEFLEPGVSYRARIYADAADAHWQSNPTAYVISERVVTAADRLEVRMAAGGGQAVTLLPVGANCR